jgi:hypothetical protein
MHQVDMLNKVGIDLFNSPLVHRTTRAQYIARQAELEKLTPAEKEVRQFEIMYEELKAFNNRFISLNVPKKVRTHSAPQPFFIVFFVFLFLFLFVKLVPDHQTNAFLGFALYLDPQCFDYVALGEWVHELRRLKRTEKLPKWQQEPLDQIGFPWKVLFTLSIELW